MLYSVPVAMSGGPATTTWFINNLPAIIEAVTLFSNSGNYVFSTPRVPNKVFKLTTGDFTIALYVGDTWSGDTTLTNQKTLKLGITENPGSCVLIVSTALIALVELYATTKVSAAFIGILDTGNNFGGSVWRNNTSQGIITDLVTEINLTPIGMDGTITAADGFYYTTDYYLRNGSIYTASPIGIKNLQMPQLLTTNFYQIAGDDIIISGGTINTNAASFFNNMIIAGGNI